MMNFGKDAPRSSGGGGSSSSSPASKENIPPSGKLDAAPVRRARQRAALGALSENEQQGRQGSQLSKHSSASSSSQLTFPSCPSSPGCGVHVEEAREVVLAASGEELFSESWCRDAAAAAMQDEDLRRLLELSSGSRQDASLPSEPEEPPPPTVALYMSEYSEDIHRHLRESEMKLRPTPGYLDQHPELTGGMRAILVDWQAEVAQEYGLGSETLHLAVNYLDRFLSHTALVKLGRLQLVGTAALLVAAKYEEILPPELDEFVYITDRTYTRRQLMRMETALLRLLSFRMAAPTANQFLRLFMSVHASCATTENLALYIAELSLLEMDPFLHYTPSIVAAGAFCLANYTVNTSLWPESLHAFTGYTVDDIAPCLTDLHRLHAAAEGHPQQTIRRKYKSSKYCHASRIAPPMALPLP